MRPISHPLQQYLPHGRIHKLFPWQQPFLPDTMPLETLPERYPWFALRYIGWLLLHEGIPESQHWKYYFMSFLLLFENFLNQFPNEQKAWRYWPENKKGKCLLLHVGYYVLEDRNSQWCNLPHLRKWAQKTFFICAKSAAAIKPPCNSQLCLQIVTLLRFRSTHASISRSPKWCLARKKKKTAYEEVLLQSLGGPGGQ